jgi:NADPH-dependent 2,4-dienoyl-CoA reductase/sulfur reductase-like enzyme
MSETWDYIIVGGGLAGASAIEGIREKDADGRILMVTRENHSPYHRPPLSKGLWTGKTPPEELPVHPEDFYRERKVEMGLRREIIEIDPESRRVWDDRGIAYSFGQLLLATGGKPRLLDVPGAAIEGVQYFRTLEDYLQLRARIERLQHVLVLGAGFIGLELAAALVGAGKEVALVYPEEYPMRRVLPRDLGLFVADYYRERGVETVSGESVVAIEEHGGLLDARTAAGNRITTQLILAGVGMTPNIDLAEGAGLAVNLGIEVDGFGQTSAPNVWAAGDVAEYPSALSARPTRTEHWDHAREHGRVVGANMAGAAKRYEHLPMFYSDFFDLGWEAVGEFGPNLETDAIWKVENREGVVYTLEEGVVVGVLLWNVWGQLDRAREILRAARPMSHEERRTAIPLEG